MRSVRWTSGPPTYQLTHHAFRAWRAAAPRRGPPSLTALPPLPLQLRERLEQLQQLLLRGGGDPTALGPAPAPREISSAPRLQAAVERPPPQPAYTRGPGPTATARAYAQNQPLAAEIDEGGGAITPRPALVYMGNHRVAETGAAE
jgi:hypothetical protein